MALPSSIIRRGTRAAQPSAASVAAGCLYFVTDENLTERSSGAAWETYSALTTSSGTNTPTLTSVTNVAASTAYALQYLRVGTTVTVSGQVDVDVTASYTLTQLGISLPIASNFANAYECAGVAMGTGANLGATGVIIGDATNNRAELQFQTLDLLNRSWSLSFTYTVI